MTKAVTKTKKFKIKLKNPAKGRIEKKKKIKENRSTKSDFPKNKPVDEDDRLVIKKKPSKAELKSVIEALRKDASLILVRKALKYIPWYLKSEGLIKKLLKEIIRLWAEAGEKTRVVCLLCLIRIYTKLNDKERKQLIIKKLYTTFLDQCRITKQETISMISFMRHSLIELYKLDPQIAFKQAQTSCQQLSLTLKNACTHKNEETYRSVLNWQFANCLILLSNLIMSHDEDSPVKSLTHQVIQINLGALNLLSSPRYYPYYCHLIENLIGLSISTDLFIPVLPLMIGILDKIQIPLPRKVDTEAKAKEEDKDYNMDLLNHVSLDEAHCFEYNSAVLDKIHQLMTRYLASQCHRIAFPELILLPCVQLKKWLKRNPGQKSQIFKSLLEKMKSDSEKIEEARRSVDFAFTNYSAVDAWEKKMKDSNKLSLAKLANK